RGLLPVYSSYYTAPMVTDGVITKTIRDTALAYDQMIHREAADAAFIPVQMPAQSYSKAIQSAPRKQKIALNTGDWTRNGTKIDPEVVARVQEVGQLLESLGHTVVEVNETEICDQSLLFENITTMLYHYGLDWKAISDATGVPINEKTLEPVYRQQVEYRARNPVTLEMKAKEREALVKVSKQVASFFARYDALLMPVDLGPASIAGPKNPISPLAPVNTQEEYEKWISLHVDDSRYNTLANFTGIPALGFPTGLISGGLPIGAQLHSRWGSDALLMQMAAQIERAKPEWSGLVPPLHTSKL
ncbi:MAG: amidase, partial [Planctomycetales bacterium]